MNYKDDKFTVWAWRVFAIILVVGAIHSCAVPNEGPDPNTEFGIEYDF